MTEQEACKQALLIHDPGACNPLGVSRTIAEMCQASLGWVKDGFNEVRRHPAIRLATYQFAFLMGMEPLDFGMQEIDGIIAECRRLAELPQEASA